MFPEIIVAGVTSRLGDVRFLFLHLLRNGRTSQCQIKMSTLSGILVWGTRKYVMPLALLSIERP